MRILMIGTGVIGGNLAHSLSMAHEITLLASERSYSFLKLNGLVIHPLHEDAIVDRFNVLDSLEENDLYDAIFVCVRYNQLDSVIPLLLKNHSQNIILVGNNLRAEKYQETLSGKNVFFAFFSTAGKRVNQVIESVCLNEIRIGRIDGKEDDNSFLHALFGNTKIRAEYDNRMDDYLKFHAADVLPLVFACYKANGNLKVLKKDKPYSLKVTEATIEGYDVLRKLGYQMTVEQYYEKFIKRKKMNAFITRHVIFGSKMGKLMVSDHATNAKEEFLLLDQDFLRLIEISGLKTPIYDELRLDFAMDSEEESKIG